MCDIDVGFVCLLVLFHFIVGLFDLSASASAYQLIARVSFHPFCTAQYCVLAQDNITGVV